MYTAEVVTTVDGQETLLYSFQFTTSRFPDVAVHLRSGQSEGGEQTVHALPPGPALPLDWLGTHRDLQDDLTTAREELRDARRRHELSIPEKLEAARSAFDALQQFCQIKFAELDSMIQERFVRIGLDHRPLPLVLEFIQLPIEGTDGSALLLESPEPLDWARMTLSSNADDVRILVLWNNDQTRAFIVQDDGRWFSHGRHDFTFHYSGDQRDFPYLEPVTQGSEPVRAEVPCTVSMGEITVE
jgi:hypothetical protein